MKIETNKRTEAPVFKVEENDQVGYVELKKLLASEGWKFLQGYFGSLRLWVEEMGKSHAQSRAKKDLCDNDFSILTGIDMAVGLPDKLMRQMELMHDAREKVAAAYENNHDDDE